MSKHTFYEPAFPVPGLQHDQDFNGMSLRDYFAAKAMQVVAQNESWRANLYTPQDGLSIMENNARLAYQIADAMLVERAK